MKIPAGIQAKWHLERYRDGVMVSKQSKTNIIPSAALDDAMDVLFNSGTQKTAWYIAPFQTDTTPVLGTTYATPVFTEATLYAEATRPLFDSAASAGGVVSSVASKASFTWSTALTIYGGALVGGGTAATTKGNTAGGGVIFSAAKFAAPDIVDPADVSKIWLEITLANA